MAKMIRKSQIGHPVDFLGFDGKTYNGRIEDVRRQRWLVFTYYVSGLGEVRCTLDLRINRERILEVW